MTSQTFFREDLPTDIGTIRILTDHSGLLRSLDWDDCDARHRRLMRRHYGDGLAVSARSAPSAARLALDQYFAGDLSAIDRIAVATGGTPFQREVWAALRRIPVGKTVSYAELAASLGRPAAVRAVGLANGANPIGIVVPCHRVIGSDGSLAGYGGGVDRKRWLLAHEGVTLFDAIR